MAESESVEAVVIQAAIQAATEVVMPLKEADVGPISGTSIASPREVHSPRQVRPALKEPSFN